MLVTQDAFLLETQRLVKLDGALVVRQRLTGDFVEFELGEGMAERCAAKLPTAAFGGIRYRIKSPIGDAPVFPLVEVHKPQRLMVDFKN